MSHAYALFLRAAALGDGVDLRVALQTWGAFCEAASAEIAAPGPLTDVAGLASMAASAHLRCADYHELLGDMPAAVDDRAMATHLVARYGEDEAQIEVRRTLANSLKSQARYGEAMAEFAALEAAYDPTAEPVKFARVLVDQAMLLEWLGDFDRAENLLVRAEALVADRLADTPAAQGKLATILGAIADMAAGEGRVQLQSLRMEIGSTRGFVAKRAGRLDDAQRHFRAVRDDHVEWGVGPAIDFHLMHLDTLAGKHQTALARLNGLDTAMRSDARMLAKLPVLHWVGALAVLDRDPAWALGRIEAGIPTLEHVADYEALWKLYRTAAEALQALDRPDEATSRFLDAARTVDQLRRVPLGYRLESTYFADRLPMFHDAITHSAAVGDGPAALELTELAKSRSLATLVYGGRRSLSNDPQAQRVDELSREIDARDFAGYNGDGADPAERAELVAQRAAAIEQIRVADPRWRALTEPAPVSADAIVSSLDGAIAVSVFVAGRTVIAVTVDASGVTVDRRDVSAATWTELDDYCANIRRAEDPFAYDLSGFGEVGLRDLLPDATCDRILAHDRAVIAPHGRLHLVPWSTLHVGPDAAGSERLFQRVGVTTMPNLMCLPAIDGPWSRSPIGQIIGAPNYAATGLTSIDPTNDELEQLCAIWQAAPTATLRARASGDASTELAMRAALQADVDVLHVICHGVVDHAEPSSSALIATDGKVDAAEVALGGDCPDEVVLAACSTGFRPASVGQVSLTGDDAVGLPAAFLEAGARSVLMSIPQAHDATSTEFMSRYHRARTAGAAPIDAFQATQIEMLDVADPGLWCGYVLYGTPTRKLR